MTSYKNFNVDFGLRIQKYSSAPNSNKIKPIFWQICKFFHISIKDTFRTKGCHGDTWDQWELSLCAKWLHKSKIKLEKFHVDILCCYGVIKESLPGGRNPLLDKTNTTLSCPSYSSVGLLVNFRFNRSEAVEQITLVLLAIVSIFGLVFFQSKSWSLFNDLLLIFVNLYRVVRGLWCSHSWSPCCCGEAEDS